MTRKRKPGARTRPRGRPPVDEDALSKRRASVIEAAGRLLAERAVSDITVEQVIKAAGTSRPTFYRWFPGGTEQVFEMLVAQANADLVARIVAVLAEEKSLQGRIEAGIRAYFEWGLDMGPVVCGIYREAFDDRSPAARHRQQSIGAVVGMVREQARALGFGHVSDLSIETVVGWVERAGVTVFRNYPVDPVDVEAQRWLTTEMALAMLQVLRAAPPSPNAAG